MHTYTSFLPHLCVSPALAFAAIRHIRQKVFSRVKKSLSEACKTAFKTHSDAFLAGVSWDDVVKDIIDSNSTHFDVMKGVLAKVADKKIDGLSISEYHKAIPCHLECAAILVSFSDI